MKRSVQLLLAAGFLLTAILISANMYLRSQEQLLWGYRPLWLFLTFTGALLFLLLPIWLNKGKTWKWLSLSGMSILFLSLGFPDIGFPFPMFLFAGFVPLLIVEQEIAASTDLRRGATVWKYAFLTFLCWNIITTFWVADTALSAGIFAIVANTGLMTIPFMLFHYTKRNLAKLGAISFAAYWISWEYFHLNWELTWPWLTLGNGFAEWPMLVQWYEYTGVFGGSLWILLGNLVLFQIWNQYNAGKRPWGLGLRLAGLLLAPVGLSLYLFYNYEEKGKPVEIVVVQPNYEPHYVKFTVPRAQQVTRMVQLADSARTPATQYIAYPEAVIHNFNIDMPRAHPAIRTFEKHFEDNPGLNLLIGISAFQVLPNDDKTSRAKRVYVNQRGDTTTYESSNIAAQLTIGSPEIPIYKKSKLVPGVEIFPFQEVLWPFKFIVEKVGGTAAGLASQPERSVFQSRAGNIGPLICYESIFGEFVTAYVRAGAQALIVITNDGWWDDTPGHRQHLHFASLRAIETRKSIARAANTGVSAFIDQRGIIQETIPYNQTQALRGNLLFNDQLTIYVRWGNIISRIAAFLSGILLLNVLVNRLSSRGPLRKITAS